MATQTVVRTGETLMVALLEFKLAVESAKQHLANNPNDPVLLRRLGDATATLAFESGFRADTRDDYDKLHREAIAIYNQARELSPNDGVLLNNLGVALSDSGSHSAAVETLRLAVAQMPDDRNSRFNLAVALMNTDEVGRREAPEHFQAARRLEPRAETREAYFDPQGH